MSDIEGIISFFREKQSYNKEYAQEARKKFLTNSLPTNKKLQLYDCSVKGDVDSLINLIEKENYPLFEEISSNGYFWTALHYAAHYGFDHIVEYVLEKIEFDPNKLQLSNLQSDKGLTPLFIAITNGNNNIHKKKRMLDVYMKFNAIDFSICTCDNLDIFDLCKKHNLLEYFASIIKED